MFASAMIGKSYNLFFCGLLTPHFPLSLSSPVLMKQKSLFKNFTELCMLINLVEIK